MNINMNNLKRNQIIIFVIALMLVSAGYLSFTANNNNNTNSVVTSSGVNSIEDVAAIGDAKLVSSNAIEEGIISDEAMSTSTENTEEVSENTDDNSAIDEAVTTNSQELDEYFSSSKLTRDTMYSQMIEAYEKILENQNIAADQKTIAQTEIKNINDTKNKIMICENLIQTKGIKDSVIFVNGDSISVIVRADNLEQDQIAQIQNIINREMQVDIDNIHSSNK